MKNYSYLVNLFLLAIAAITGWMVWSSSEFTSKSAAVDTNKADAFMSHVLLTQFTEEGSIDYQLITPTSVHYPKDNATAVEKPDFTIYSKDPHKMPWEISSVYGELTNGVNHIHLWDHVVIKQQMTNSTGVTSMLTSQLHYYPLDHIAKTNTPVKMDQPGLNITATGINVNFDSGVAKLLSSVRGEYDPTKKQ